MVCKLYVNLQNIGVQAFKQVISDKYVESQLSTWFGAINRFCPGSDQFPAGSAICMTGQVVGIVLVSGPWTVYH